MHAFTAPEQGVPAGLLLHFLSAGEDLPKANELTKLSLRDWKELARQSIEHGVAPLLYSRIETLGGEANVAVETWQVLRSYYLHNALRNVRLYHRLAGLLREFRAAAIDLMVLKGS